MRPDQHRTVFVAGAICLCALTPAWADGHADAAARLSETLGLPAEGDQGAVRFEQVAACQYAKITESSAAGAYLFSARSVIDFSAATFTQVDTDIDEENALGAIRIKNPDEIDAVSYRTDYFEVPAESQETLTNIGATCEGSTCLREGMRDSLTFYIRGDDLETRLAAVEADLLALGAACAPN